jgi:pyruvate dehydrogenase E2 component (dihydrolipoamide acetyltransferase)
MSQIIMPRLSDSMEQGTILTWLKRDGEDVQAGDELVEIETDKATVTFESPESGTLAIMAQEGATLPVGTPIAQLGAGAPAPSTRPDESDAPPEPDQLDAGSRPTGRPLSPATPPATTINGAGSDRAGLAEAVKATPLARRMADAHDLDLAAVEGTGPGGRITRGDVASRLGIAPGPAPPTAAAPAPPADASLMPARDGPERVEPTRVQAVIARRMSTAKATIPHFQVQTEAEMDGLIALRAGLEQLFERPPSINDFIIKACALALRQHPHINASYADGVFEVHPRVNVGVAVAAERTLIVPTIFDADMKSLRMIAAESRRLAERVRAGTIAPRELSGATFTVSNLGMYGMTAITPVINPPQAAILGIGAARAVPAIADGQMVEHSRMTLTLSCDHRILYGADAAQFLSTIRELLEVPLQLGF